MFARLFHGVVPITVGEGDSGVDEAVGIAVRG